MTLLPAMLLKPLILGVAATAVWMTAVVEAVDTNFWHGLILVFASSASSGGFAIWVAHLNASAQERLHRRLEQVEMHQSDVARALGLSRRASDPDVVQERRADG
jgi:hypothetical protein